MNAGEILLEVVRNEMVESVHSGHLLILDGAGREVLSLGDPDEIIYPRSAIKSLQASAMVRSGLKLSAEQLAIVCASHAGSEAHLKNVLSILDTCGRSESDLKNTPDRPLGSAERSAWGERPASSLAANCSGKHAGMVATCVAHGWDIGSYKDVNHPLQIAIRREIETLTGNPVAKVGVDGCGAPLFAMSLHAMARSVRTMRISDDPVHSEVVNACMKYPVMVSGVGRLPTILMESVDGLFVKDGAEGVMVASLADGSVMVWKMSDGSQRGASSLAAAGLAHLGISVGIERDLVYGDGRVVGEIRASKLVHHA